MSIGGNFFITPHALHRFQQRICPLSESDALAAIIKSLANPAVSAKLQKDGTTVRVRTRTPFKFRAFITPPKCDGDYPAVVTIFEG
jgi:hypothetical protein